MDSYEKIIEWLARMDCIRILKYTEEVVIFYLLSDDNEKRSIPGDKI
jgi:hypothetical protein